ncbi:hypothetical protein [Vibrio vulnificus YJ016]|uniref:Uncharacterized protein n=1 Tax=Vibrio vulnificus (strain YJ016) TaxID=196600 RepID=Q7MDW2_VIBVY|nr:hypothetical protein [Vibrio vulnificus YJ016]
MQRSHAADHDQRGTDCLSGQFRELCQAARQYALLATGAIFNNRARR